jgi:extracellular elastinolytic metalloproteinase
MYHDLLYRLGFDEVSGNFQMDNFGRGGLGGDGVICQAQDGSGTDNASKFWAVWRKILGFQADSIAGRWCSDFMTPPDGKQPRMRMYVWDTATVSTRRERVYALLY